MTVKELIEELQDFGDHIPVVVYDDGNKREIWALVAGNDDNGVAACVIRAYA